MTASPQNTLFSFPNISRFHSEIFESSPDCIKILDLEGKLVSMNRNGQCIMEIDDFSEICGSAWPELWPEESYELAQAAVHAARNGSTTRIEAFCPTAKGKPKWWDVVVSPIFGNNGQVEHLLSVSRDITDLYQAKEELRANFAHLQFALDAGQVGEWVLDLTTGETRHSVRHDHCFGYKAPIAEWNFGIFIQHVHPQDRSLVTTSYETAIKELTDQKFECRVIWPDGSVHWISVHGSIYRSSDGNATHMLGIIFDITERKRTEILASSQKKALEMAVASAPLFDILDTLVRAAEECCGGTVKVSVLLLDADGKHLRHGAAPSLPKSYYEAIDGVAIGPAVGSCGTAAFLRQEVVARDIPSDPRWINYRELAHAHGLGACWSQPIFSSKGKVLGTLAAYHHAQWEPSASERDATALLVNTAALILDQRREAEERNVAEQALRKSEAHLASIFQQTAAGIAETDLDGCIIRANDQLCKILGRSREELIGQPIHNLIYPEDLEENLSLLQNLIKKGVPFEIENRYQLPDGKQVWVSKAVTTIRSTDGQSAESVLAVVLDITERKQAEEELRNADKRKDEFLAMLAHELRNPLAPISAAAELMKMVQLDEARLKQTSQIIIRQVRHMTGLVDDLLDVSRVTTGLVTISKTAQDLKTIVSAAVEQVRPLIEAQRHHLTMDLAREPACVLGDQKRLVQVFTNLLNNAVKYTPEGGNIHLKLEVEDKRVMLSVLDDGIGIEEDMQRHVFELFAQAQRSSDRSQGGLGIGLALVKSLVDMHGGEVICFSKGLGKGTRFTVALPRLTEQRDLSAGSQNARAIPLPAKKLRILVVDDNADAAQMLAMLLEASGHEVLVENSSPRALERAKIEVPDVCILDIGLPEMDGNELARRLRAQRQTDHIPLIAVTGYGQEGDRVRTLAAGFDHHLVKPVDTKLVALILAEINKA